MRDGKGEDHGASSAADALLDCALPLARIVRRAYEGYTLTVCSLMATVARRAPIMLSEVAKVEGLSLPTVSRVVQGLVEEGLIDRVQDPRDRRVYLVSVTKAGEDWMQVGREKQRALLAARLKPLDPGEVDALHRSEGALRLLAELESESDIVG